MKEIVFFDSYSSMSGGAPKSLLTLMILLKSKGYKPCLYTSVKGETLDKYHKKGIECNVIGVPEFVMRPKGEFNRNFKSVVSYFLLIIYTWYRSLLILPDLKSKNICFNDIRCFLFFLPIAVIMRRRLIWYVRINAKIPFINDFAAFISSKIIFISKSCLQMFSEKKLSAIREKTFLLHTGFPVPKYSAKVSEDLPCFAFVAVLSERKNLELLIETSYLLKLKYGNQFKIVVAGSVKEGNEHYLNRILNLIDSLGVQDQFEFIGNKEDLSSLYQSSDAVVLTSFAEGLPRVVLEGLSYGCYVISTPVDGVDEILIDSNLGEVTSTYSKNELLNAMSDYLSNREFHLHNRKLRTEFIENNFSEESYVNGFIEIL